MSSSPVPPAIHDVGDDAAGQRLDLFVAAVTGCSRSQAANRIDDGLVRIDGEQAARSAKVRAGQRVEVGEPEAPPTGGGGRQMPPIRYEDEHLMIIAKPPAMVVHPGVGHTAGTLVQILADAGYDLAPAGGDERPGIVHRLDRDTSGLLLVAKTDPAYHGLVEALRERDIERRYLALIQGEMAANRGRVEAPIGRDPRNRKRFAAVAEGKHAVTHWQVLEVGRSPADQVVSAIACRLETGRTHQIRVHLAYAGRPVVADPLYGARADIADDLGMTRPALHAASLRLTHPVTGEQIAVDEPAPDDLVAAASACGIDLSALASPG